MDLAKFKKEGTHITLYVPAITQVNEDGSFLTRALSRGKDMFGRDNTLGHYRTEKTEHKDINKIVPEIEYEMFERTDDPKEADILAISYYAGTDMKKVVKTLDSKKFIVNEKLQIEDTIDEIDEETGFRKKVPHYHNTILEYIATKHHPKRLEEVGYDGDCNTEIELTEDCKYKMYKFIGVGNKV